MKKGTGPSSSHRPPTETETKKAISSDHKKIVKSDDALSVEDIRKKSQRSEALSMSEKAKLRAEDKRVADVKSLTAGVPTNHNPLGKTRAPTLDVPKWRSTKAPSVSPNIPKPPIKKPDVP